MVALTVLTHLAIIRKKPVYGVGEVFMFTCAFATLIQGSTKRFLRIFEKPNTDRFLRIFGMEAVHVSTKRVYVFLKAKHGPFLSYFETPRAYCTTLPLSKA